MRELTTGNYAVAEAVRLARAELVAAYPITPQTPIYEKLAEMDAQGKLPGIMVKVESEHSAMAECVAASMAGVRVFTATASQGLALMHEMLHFASGNRTPVVMACVNRVIAAPWAFGSDQTDTLAQRDTGWMQFYCEDGQEALDTVIQAYRIAEKALIPVMVIMDAFFTSHFMEPIEIPEQAVVDRFLPAPKLPERFDVKHPASISNVVNAVKYMEFREQSFRDMEGARPLIKEADGAWGKLTGRTYGVIEAIQTKDAEIVLVTTGAMTSSARLAQRKMREDGVRVGLLKIKAFRPFPYKEVQEAVSHVRKVAVIDRNCSMGKGGIFCAELKSALCNLDKRPKVWGYIAGLSGANVSPEMIEGVVRKTLKQKNPGELPEWISEE
ncbi:MAG TPA: hypothetical protein VGJ94_10150 [Syntrophorhabdaceae bacterium]|jgi:pyruvate/2-oxoacid:ferredoxin oxidoreductase alpha subunit